MKTYIDKKDFSKIYSIANGMFTNVNGKHISQFIKISAKNNQVIFEYFNEKDYFKMFYNAKVEECGSVIVSFDILKIINSLNGLIKINYNEEKKTLYFSDSKKILNAPPAEIDFELQHPFGKHIEIELPISKFVDEIKFLKTTTHDADVQQDRFKNILINASGNNYLMVAAAGHFLVFLKKQNSSPSDGKFYIPRSIVNCLTPLKKISGKKDIIRISNFDSYHTQIESSNILIHSSYETKEFIDYSKWKKAETSSVVMIKKKDLMECLNSLLLLNPLYDKIEFLVKDKYLKFYSVKNSEVDMKALIDISKAKNPLKYSGNFSGKGIKNFISRLSNEDDITMGLDVSRTINIIQTTDSKMICHTLAMKGV